MTRITTLNAPNIHLAALDAALRAALPNKVFGLNASIGANGLVTVRNNNGQVINGQFAVILDDATIQADDTTAQTVTDAHDPVFIAADKMTILANGTDVVIITINAPKQGAAPIVLLINSIPTPVPLKSGVGQVKISSPTVGALNISLQNPGNRSADVLTVQAITPPPPPVALPTIVVM